MDDIANSRSTPEGTRTQDRVWIACEDLFFRINLEARVREAGMVPFSVSTPDALEKALDPSAPPPRAAAVDVHLPKDRAFELIRRISQARPGIPLLAFGAHTEKEMLARAQEAGAAAMPRSRFVREFPAMLQKVALGLYKTASE